MDMTGNAFNPEDFGGPCPMVLTSIRCKHGAGGLHGPLRQRSWVVDYSITNCGSCRVGSEDAPWLPRTPGIAHLYPPETRYWEDTREAPFSLSSYIIFDGAEQCGMDKLAKNAKGFARILDPEGKLGELLDEMAFAATRGNDGFLEVMAGFYRLAALLQRSKTLEKPWERILDAASEEKRSLSSEALAIISKSLDRPLSLEALAKELGTSQSTLSHKYREETGESPAKTHLRLRLNLAKGLLLKGESVKSSAARTGFYDEFHFSRAFKKLCGVSPSVYAKRQLSL